MVAENAVIDGKPAERSLAHTVQHLLEESSHPWLRSLSARGADFSRDSECVDLDTSASIRPDNEDMAASHLAHYLLPALRAHSRSFNGREASVVINQKDKAGNSPATTLSGALEIDLSRLWEDINRGLEQIDFKTDKSTLYTIRLGSACYRMLTLSCQKEPEDWQGYRTWREHIKHRYGVHVLISTDSSPKSLLEQSSSSPISSEDISSRAEKYYQGARHIRLPEGLRGLVDDWRDVPFISIDDGSARRPEDLHHIMRRNDEVLAVKSIFPLSANGVGSGLFFEPFQDRFSIGVKTLIDGDGTPLAIQVAPVIAHNTAAIDFFSASHVANQTSVSPDSVYHQRIEQIRDNSHLNQQIDGIYEFASRILRRQMNSGNAVAVDFQPGAGRSLPDGRRFQSEMAIGAVIGFTQHLIAHWVLQSEQAPSLIALRPHFRDNGTLEKIYQLLPGARRSDLLNPAERNRIARNLEMLDRHDLVAGLAEVIRNAHKHRRLVPVHSSEDIRPEDQFRFKAMKSLIGNLNNLQVSHLLLGSPAMERRIVTGLAEELNKKHSSRSGHKTEEQESLEGSIRRGNMRASEIIRGL